MPAHIRKGLITGAPAFNSGGLGLSIGTRVGGIRHRIAARAPDGGKTDGGGELVSFVVNDFPNLEAAYINVDRLTNLVFLNFASSIQHPTYSILQNKNNVFIGGLIIDEFDVCGNSIRTLPLLKFITNATSSSFEIEIPPINANNLSNLQVTDYSGGSLFFVLSGAELFKGTSSESFIDGDTFFVDFVVDRDTPLEQVRTMLQNYTGKTYKFELYTNDSGAIIVNNTTYKVNKFTVSG